MSTIEFYSHFEEVNSKLQGFALQLTKDQEQAQELVQETVVRALRYKDRFTVGTNFKAWITTMMRNIFLNQKRDYKRRKTESIPNDSLYLNLEGSKTTDNMGEHQIIAEEIMKAIEALNENLKSPFWLFYQGYAYDEIAIQLGIPLGTVKSRIFKARQRLKYVLKDQYAYA
ncbi:MAG: sigma-70 family RNA polymerase sigma factor [Bacteroidota bacterium]